MVYSFSQTLSECFQEIPSMTRRKKVKVKIVSLQKQIHAHEDKIRMELEKSNPNLERIKHWSKEITIFHDQVDRYKRILGTRRKDIEDDE
jgi:hypothetical protein